MKIRIPSRLVSGDIIAMPQMPQMPQTPLVNGAMAWVTFSDNGGLVKQ